MTEALSHKGTEDNKIIGTCWETFHLCDEMKEGFNLSCVIKVNKHPPAHQHLSRSSAGPAAAVLPALILVCHFEKAKYRKASALVNWIEEMCSSSTNWNKSMVEVVKKNLIKHKKNADL